MHPDLIRDYWQAQRLWSGSYFAGSVGGAPLSIVKRYIEQQNRRARHSQTWSGLSPPSQARRHPGPDVRRPGRSSARLLMSSR
ncbi:transposase [Streptomyces canus]|uniref:transposase n=1 Tax=Streptomyces canus TaxID=58343 RepID=UPI0037DA21C3